MASPEFSEFIDYGNKLLDATRSGDIDWTKANPTTFVWEVKSPKRARVTLQQVDRRERDQATRALKTTRAYVFNVHDLATGAVANQRLSVSGTDDPEVNEILKTLFETIASGVTRKGLDFLKSVIPSK